MAKSLTIEIIKDGRKLANVLFLSKEYFTSLLARVRNIIDNYNQNLSNADLEGKLLAVRMIDEENADGTRHTHRTDLYKESEIFMSMFHMYNEHKPTGGRQDGMIIGVTEEDMHYNLTVIREPMIAQINLDKRIVSIVNAYKTHIIKGHEKEIDETSLNFCPYNFFCLPFNELEDAYLFVSNNYDGWKIEGIPDTVFVPE